MVTEFSNMSHYNPGNVLAANLFIIIKLDNLLFVEMFIIIPLIALNNFLGKEKFTYITNVTLNHIVAAKKADHYKHIQYLSCRTVHHYKQIIL